MRLWLILSLVCCTAHADDQFADSVARRNGGIEFWKKAQITPDSLVKLWVAYDDDSVEQCYITPDFRVFGKVRDACVEELATAARLAKAEAIVNKRRKKSR